MTEEEQTLVDSLETLAGDIALRVGTNQSISDLLIEAMEKGIHLIFTPKHIPHDKAEKALGIRAQVYIRDMCYTKDMIVSVDMIKAYVG